MAPLPAANHTQLQQAGLAFPRVHMLRELNALPVTNGSLHRLHTGQHWCLTASSAFHGVLEVSCSMEEEELDAVPPTAAIVSKLPFTRKSVETIATNGKTQFISVTTNPPHVHANTCPSSRPPNVFTNPAQTMVPTPLVPLNCS
jgi:hypothetical protein